jgi:hypothetical protein
MEMEPVLGLLLGHHILMYAHAIAKMPRELPGFTPRGRESYARPSHRRRLSRNVFSHTFLMDFAGDE